MNRPGSDLVCHGCGWKAAERDPYPFRCPNSGTDDADHVVIRALDGLTFTSGSTVRGLHALLSPPEALRATALPAYCIGPVTAGVARRLGFNVVVVSARHTAAALAEAIHAHLSREVA